MTVANLIALVAFFSPRRVVKFLGLCGGQRRRRQDSIAWVLLTPVAVVIAAKTLFLAALHLVTFKGVTH